MLKEGGIRSSLCRSFHHNCPRGLVQEDSMMKISIVLLALAGALAITPAAFADTTAWEFTSTGSTLNNGNGYSLGDVFTVNTTINVDFLGYFANDGAGSLTENHPVALYNAAGDLLASTTINSSAGYFTDHFVYNPISTITLFAGQTYVIDGASGFSDLYAWNDPGFTVYAPITLLGDNWTEGNGDYFTGTSVIGDVSDGYWGPNFGFSAAAATPEPSSLMLLGTGLVGLAGMLRRKLKA